MKGYICKSFTLLFLLSFIVLPGIVKAQTRDSLISRAIDYIYQMKSDSAALTSKTLINLDPKDPSGYFMSAMTEWWKIYINKDDQSNDGNYLSAVDECIQVCDERIEANSNDDWALFLKGGVIGYRGFLNSMRDNWLKAVDDGREGLSLLQRAHELNPNNKDAIFGIGLYNYAADYVTEKYPFLKTLLFFFPKGDKQLGLAQLKDCAENAKFSKIEANFVLCYVNLIYEKNYFESEKYAEKIFKLYPDNPIAEKYLGRSYAGLNKWNESIALWRDILAKSDSNKTGYNNNYIRRESYYYLGLSNMRVNRIDEAFSDYQQAEKLSSELDKDNDSPYKVFSVLGMGMISDLRGDHNLAVNYYDRVLDMKEIESSHDAAKKFKIKGYK
jgi:tetratricopeptide (TPR) repeat protein